MDFRHEFKYIISTQQALLLKERMSGIMSYDTNTGDKGTYEIRSLYFDDCSDSYYYQNEAGTDPRAKFRIRIYNGSKDEILLEKKMKKSGMTKKLKQSITMAQYQMLTGFSDSDTDPTMACHIGHHMWDLGQIHEETSLVQELLLLKQTKLMEPKIIVTYERTPFIEKNGNVRITFDDGIFSSGAFDTFFDERIHGRSIMPVGQTLMEVKYDEFLPGYIREALEDGHLQQTTFSKYYLCRRYHL